MTLAKPTLKQILEALKNQVLIGHSYLDVGKGLLQADPVILQTAPTFFGLTMNGALELAQMALARLYDTTGGAITIPKMLAQATQGLSLFQRGSKHEVTTAIADSRKVVEDLKPVLAAIRRRRNEWLAHLDPRTVADPKALAARAKLTLPDLERAFRETEGILIRLSCLYDGTVGELKFIGGDDYKSALDWIRRAKCGWIERYEQKFGTEWTGPRPKDCSREKFDLL